MKKGDAEVSSDEVYLCIGARGGATAEQELNAHKIAKMSKAQRDPSPGFAREYTGKVKVTEILDEQFARVVSISEKVKMDSIVEPTKP